MTAFLFTDIEDSTALWERYPQGMRTAIEFHHDAIRDAVERHQGRVVKDLGDGFFVHFESPQQALEAALEAQRRLMALEWPEARPMRVRMGLHAGVAEVATNGDLRGGAVNRAARVMGAGHGEQIVVSADFASVIETPDGCWFESLGHHRLKGLSGAVELFQVHAEGLRRDFPPLRTLDGLPNNLPHSFSLFVGRDSETRDVLRALSDRRLVTVLGPGGAGKTRLALNAACEALPDFADGAWLVELAGLGDPDLVPGALGAALGLEVQPTQRWIDSICRHLEQREALLLLDNCEHLLDATATLVEEVLARCPTVRVLATSREALNVGGEHTWSLGALSLPPEDTAELDLLLDSDAAVLFIERARSARSDFAPSAGEVRSIVEICRRLDGMPLAIELAAARVRGLPVTEIAARLSDRFRFLVGGSRTALARQRTLEATVAWSYQLLDPSEQRLFSRLSVFAGSFSLEAAEMVCVDLEPDVLGGILSLVEKSLLEPHEAFGQARYRMLETLRMFGRDQLVGTGDSVTARDQLVRWAASFVSDVANTGVGLNERHWIDIVDREIDNLRSAIQWTIESRDSAGLLIAGHLRTYWINTGTAEGQGWLRQLLQMPSTSSSDRAEAIGRLAYGHGLQWQGRCAEGLEHLKRAAAHFRESGDTNHAAYTAQIAARCHWGLGELEAARPLLHESVIGHHQSGDLHGELLARFLATSLELHLGQLDAARAMLADADEFARHAGSPRMAAHLDECAFTLEALAGQPGLARDRLREAVLRFRSEGVHHCIAHGLQATSYLAVQMGDYRNAGLLHGAAKGILDNLGIDAPPWERLFRQPVLDACADALATPDLGGLLAQGAHLGLDRGTELAIEVIDSQAYEPASASDAQ